MRTVLRCLAGAVIIFIIKMTAYVATPIKDTNLDLAYGILAFIGMQFGPIVGAASGLLGPVGSDLLTYHHLWWNWPGASGLYGLIFGLWGRYIQFNRLTTLDRRFYVRFNVVQIFANLVIWGVITPVGDIFGYGTGVQHAFVVGIMVALANIVTTSIIGGLLAHEFLHLKRVLQRFGRQHHLN